MVQASRKGRKIMEYGVLKENYISCEGESYISYGIRCINTGREVSDVTIIMQK